MTTLTNPTIRDISELKRSKGTIFIQNNTHTTVTCNTGDMHMEFGPKGSTTCIQPVDSKVLDVPGVQRMLLAGKLTATNDPDFFDKFLSNTQSGQKARDESLSKHRETLEPPPAENDIVVKNCLVSGKPVTQTARQVREMIPPLAPEFKHLASEYVPTEVIKDGKVEMIFQHRNQ
jgi:hypothetical protein